MKLLEAQPEIAPGAPPAPPHEAPPETPADPGARTCSTCGATMEPGQDWCLACGAASGPLDATPGRRASATILGLLAVLVAGAVAASYAALREDQTTPPTQAQVNAAQVAQAPPATAAPDATATPPPADTTTTPDASTSTGKSTLPKVSPPAGTSSSPAPAPTPAPQTSPPAAATPAPASPPATSTGSGTSTGSTPTPGQTTTGGQTTNPSPTTPIAMDLAESAGSVYDPYRRATAVGVPGKALDHDGSTSWYVDTAPGQPQVGMGYVVNIGSAKGIKAVDVTTPTPGFKVEIYATDEPTPPPAITDTRWAHITDKGDVGTDGKTHIVLGAGSSKYQTLLLWITKPPTSGTRVRISELKVFG
jgi:hypothetical protein